MEKFVMITMLITNCDCNELCNHYDYRQYFSITIISSITWEFYAHYRFTSEEAGHMVQYIIEEVLDLKNGALPVSLCWQMMPDPNLIPMRNSMGDKLWAHLYIEECN